MPDLIRFWRHDWLSAFDPLCECFHALYIPAHGEIGGESGSIEPLGQDTCVQYLTPVSVKSSCVAILCCKYDNHGQGNVRLFHGLTRKGANYTKSPTKISVPPLYICMVCTGFREWLCFQNFFKRHGRSSSPRRFCIPTRWGSVLALTS